MPKSQRDLKQILDTLHERSRELSCLYRVEELLMSRGSPPEQILQEFVELVVTGWQHPESCGAVLEYDGQRYATDAFAPTPWMISREIKLLDEVVGSLSVGYLEEYPPADSGPFLTEELRLLNSLAERLGAHLLHQKMKGLQENLLLGAGDSAGGRERWRGPVHFLRECDRGLYLRISRKLLNRLCRLGVAEAQSLLSRSDAIETAGEIATGEKNVAGKRQRLELEELLSDRPFELAALFLSESEILSSVQSWLQADKAGAFIKILENPRSSLNEIAEAIQRYHALVGDGAELPRSTMDSLRVSLVRRFLTEQLDFIRIAKDHVSTFDFQAMIERMVLPAESHGKLGGKGAGLFLAHRILEHAPADERPACKVKVPQTYYVVSDGIVHFVGYNDLEEVIEQKYKEIDQVRQEYPNILQLFKHSPLPPELVRGISLALDNLGQVPLIVRSSSLLEDRLGTAFSGKYRSIFLANQGDKQERLVALLDAICEVYASTVGPDPIEYRRANDLLDFNEEMGILIQEVVGRQIGKYWFPAFAGVVFSNNEFRWSPRIRREDGLVRMVPGLGTRAVDRVGDDYPVLMVPGQPDLRAGAELEEIIRYSPRWMDVINLESNRFETVAVADLLGECGRDFPAFEKVFSTVRDGMLAPVVPLLFDPDEDELLPTFQGLFGTTTFVSDLRRMLRILKENLHSPIDLEFAHDGRDFYLLQCRPQSSGEEGRPAPIPKDLPRQDILFTANRHVSNGSLPDITHVVYVDPARYGQLMSEAEMIAVGRAVGRLNKLLPKRQFILMGPGRWGSRGDCTLGVNVTYADINNTAMLVEIAKQRDGYLPDLSFGTHFFQDLVESRIRYLPLYPDDAGVVFADRFFEEAPNLLKSLLPEYEHLADILRVIDVPAAAEGRVLRVLLNADLDRAVGVLRDRRQPVEPPRLEEVASPRPLEGYWAWRLHMAELVASRLDGERFGVAAVYVFGSARNATARPDSDIDLLVHFRGSDAQKRDLESWLEGWSLCLGEMNYLQTGVRVPRLLDVHLVTDEEVARETGYAAQIGSGSTGARKLALRNGK
ncbi:MAG: PEP/pyruvate-binding domain-containing protein [Candidatus Krumholzibacteriia bacterium]